MNHVCYDEWSVSKHRDVLNMKRGCHVAAPLWYSRLFAILLARGLDQLNAAIPALSRAFA